MNNKGFTTLSLALTLLIVPIACLVGLRFYNTIQNGTQMQKSSTTKSQITSIKYWLMAQAADPDSDGNAELLKEATGNALPLSIPFKTSDEWGKNYRYYTWDLATVNTNAAYSQNTAAPPLAGLIGRIVSAGKDGTFQTTSSSTTAQGDDIMFDITNTDVQNNTNTSGWFEDVVNNTVSLLTGGRKVGIGTAAPQEKLEVYGAGRFGSAGFGQIRIGRDDGTSNWLETLDSNRNIRMAANGTGKLLIDSETTVSANLTANNVVSGDDLTRTKAITAGDPNNVLPSGFYTYNGSSNVPYNGYWHIINQRSNNTAQYDAVQTATNLLDNTATMYRRVIYNSTYYAWVQASSSGITTTTIGTTWATIPASPGFNTYTYLGGKQPLFLNATIQTYGGGNNGGKTWIRWRDSAGNVLRTWTYIGGTNVNPGPDGGSGMADAFLATIPMYAGTYYVDFQRTGGNSPQVTLNSIMDM